MNIIEIIHDHDVQPEPWTLSNVNIWVLIFSNVHHREWILGYYNDILMSMSTCQVLGIRYQPGQRVLGILYIPHQGPSPSLLGRGTRTGWTNKYSICPKKTNGDILITPSDNSEG